MSFEQINWGSVDAEQEPEVEFNASFIEPPSLPLLLGDDYWIITGEKGSGKTALRRKLEQDIKQRRPDGRSFASINFKTGDFETFEQTLASLASHTEIPALRLLGNYWEYLIVVESIRYYYLRDSVFAESIDRHADDLMRRFLGLPANDEAQQSTVIGRYMRMLMERAWTIFEDNDDRRYSGAADEGQKCDQKTKVLLFPSKSKTYLTARNVFSDYLKDNDFKLVIALDGFDRFYPEDCQPIHIQSIFYSLLECLREISLLNDFRSRLIVKAFIPHDRCVKLRIRDVDKIRAMQMRIRWDPDSLRYLIGKRINLSLKTTWDFDHAWKSIVPSMVKNRRYEIEENSFDYVLRHTMWRPRQIQTHLRSIRQRCDGKIVDGPLIERAVRASCEDLVQDFIAEYQVEHPYMRSFLARFTGRPNIMPYPEFAGIVTDCLKGLSTEREIWTFDSKLRVLYRIGFFGVIEKDDFTNKLSQSTYFLPRKRVIPPYCCRFYYKTEEPQPNLPQLTQSDEIAIHPIFFDYCRQRADPDRLVG